MKFVLFLIVCCIILPNVLGVFDILPIPNGEVNLTHWREQRRQKRFIIFENAGTAKISVSLGYPIDLGDKRPWRQMAISYTLSYQLPAPGRPYNFWDKWSKRNLPHTPAVFRTPETLLDYKDEVQEFIYKFAENLMERWDMNGRACVQRSICENAQIHIHQGLFSEILHRVLRPQRNLNSDYTEAWHMGKKGWDCQAFYPEATKCLLDDYTHVREDYQQQNFVKQRCRTCA